MRSLSDAGEEALLEHILKALPPSDLGEYPIELFRSYARHGCLVRGEFPWCRALPEGLFLRDVLAPRVNTEELCDCRPLFYKELAPRVRGLSLEDAILEVNRWCAQHVTYRSTDDRTSSPLAVYRRGWGRCGEESTFTVNALRSVGIAARQVYAPFWSHCDDNHAWVEAWDGWSWRYLGACEPEPLLDRGWFTGAAARAMLIHTRWFVGEGQDFSRFYPHTDPVDLDLRDGVLYETLTARYAPTKICTVTVQTPDGAPAAGARVTFSVLNMAAFRPIAQRVADKTGTARLRLGLGSVFVAAQWPGGRAEALWDTRESARLTLTGPAPGGLFTFWAPAAPDHFPPPLTAQQKARRADVLEEAASLRRERPLRPAQGPWALLSEKDRSEDVDPRVLEGCDPQKPPELVSPRVGLEPLRFWSSPDLGRDPEEIWKWVRALSVLPGYKDLPQSPLSALALGAAGEGAKDVLFCALCRRAGVPARLSPIDGAPEYQKGGLFQRPGDTAMASLSLRAPAGRGAICGQDYTLSRLKNGEWKPLSTGHLKAGEARTLSLPAGAFRLLTAVRLPGGDQLFWQEDFDLQAGEPREIPLRFPRPRSGQLLQSLPLPPFPGREHLGDKPYTLFCWLEPGREPTEHLLGELKKEQAGFRAWGDRCAVRLFTPENADYSGLSALSRQLFVEPERLPLVLLAQESGRGLYACSGYNVGTGALLLQLLQAAQEKTTQEEPENGK